MRNRIGLLLVVVLAGGLWVLLGLRPYAPTATVVAPVAAAPERAVALSPAAPGSVRAVVDGLGLSRPKGYSEATAQLIDTEVQRILDECYAQGVELLSTHRPQLDALAGALLDHETLDEHDIHGVTGLPPVLEDTVGPVTARRARSEQQRDRVLVALIPTARHANA